MEALPLVIAVMFVAELGDKSQLLALSFATRYPMRTVLVGLLLAALTIHGLSVTLGAGLAAVVPRRVITVAGGLLFVAFGGWTLRSANQEPDVDARHRYGPAVVTVTAGFLLAEFGDKTMLASVTLAATYGVFVTWAGATIGMFCASGLAAVLGRHLAHRVGPRAVRFVAAGLFFLVGVLLLAGVA